MTREITIPDHEASITLGMERRAEEEYGVVILEDPPRIDEAKTEKSNENLTPIV